MSLSLGIDIVDKSQVTKYLSMSKHRLFNKVLAPDENKYIKKNQYREVNLFACAFALKEASMKALGCGWLQGVHWKDIEVDFIYGLSEPRIVLRNNAYDLFTKMKYTEMKVQLSVSKNQVFALVVFL